MIILVLKKNYKCVYALCVCLNATLTHCNQEPTVTLTQYSRQRKVAFCLPPAGKNTPHAFQLFHVFPPCLVSALFLKCLKWLLHRLKPEYIPWSGRINAVEEFCKSWNRPHSSSCILMMMMMMGPAHPTKRQNPTVLLSWFPSILICETQRRLMNKFILVPKGTESVGFGVFKSSFPETRH